MHRSESFIAPFSFLSVVLEELSDLTVYYDRSAGCRHMKKEIMYEKNAIE